MIALTIIVSGGTGVSAAECTASTCCNVALLNLPLATTRIHTSQTPTVCEGGTLPVAYMEKLLKLTYLNLGYNYKLSGVFPAAIWRLAKLSYAPNRYTAFIDGAFGQAHVFVHAKLNI